MPEQAAVLFANDAFYVAFAGGDMAAMDEVWAEDAPVTCIHPGWRPLEGREEVMASWRSILTAPTRPQIRVQHARAHVLGTVAYVICHEILDRGVLVATNVFVKTGNRWKMIHHQAGEAPPPDEDEDEDEPPEVVQ